MASETITVVVGSTARIQTPVGGEYEWVNPETGERTKADPGVIGATSTSPADVTAVLTVVNLARDIGAFYMDLLVSAEGTWLVTVTATGIGPQSAAVVKKVFVRGVV